MSLSSFSLRALLIAAFVAPAAGATDNPARQSSYWAKGVAEVDARAKNVKAAKARNVILFVGDGMGISTITAARIFDAQRRAEEAGGTYPGFAGGEENTLSFEKFPSTALVRTYNTDAQVPDSAGTATAMMTGAKTRIGVIGILPEQGADTCRTPDAFPRSMGELARARGMGLGIVTDTRITHATPASVYAHAPNRNWEGADKSYPADARKSGCPDIASQLVSFAPGFDVALGGGRNHFLPAQDGGTRDDGRNLLKEWQGKQPDGTIALDASSFRSLDPRAKGPVLGIFNKDHISYRLTRDPAKEPSLAEMASFAVRKLQARGGGYFLLVEAGRIDHAHHMSNAWRALDETVELSRAVDAVMDLVDTRDTLVMVTADHSHTLTIAGYPPRGHNILGEIPDLSEGDDSADQPLLNDRGQPMTTLGYRNGPFKAMSEGRVLSRTVPSTDPDFLQDKLDGMSSETHGGEDVALYATGPGSALVSGTIEQSSIFHIMARVLGWR